MNIFKELLEMADPQIACYFMYMRFARFTDCGTFLKFCFNLKLFIVYKYMYQGYRLAKSTSIVES